MLRPRVLELIRFDRDFHSRLIEKVVEAVKAGKDPQTFVFELGESEVLTLYIFYATSGRVEDIVVLKPELKHDYDLLLRVVKYMQDLCGPLRERIARTFRKEEIEERIRYLEDVRSEAKVLEGLAAHVDERISRFNNSLTRIAVILLLTATAILVLGICANAPILQYLSVVSLALSVSAFALLGICAFGRRWIELYMLHKVGNNVIERAREIARKLYGDDSVVEKALESDMPAYKLEDTLLIISIISSALICLLRALPEVQERVA